MSAHTFCVWMLATTFGAISSRRLKKSYFLAQILVTLECKKSFQDLICVATILLE